MLFHWQIKVEQARIFFENPTFGTEVVQKAKHWKQFLEQLFPQRVKSPLLRT